jgi:hypothetical protein
MDSKYGRLFTEEDVVKFAQQALRDNAGMDRAPSEDRIRADLSDFTGKFPVDEPLFLLRGQDKYATDAVDEYLFSVKQGNAPEEFIGQVEQARGSFYDFESAHRDRMKLPD